MANQELKLDIEEITKHEKQKVVSLEAEVLVFFGVYCSESVHILNHKEIRVSIGNS